MLRMTSSTFNLTQSEITKYSNGEAVTRGARGVLTPPNPAPSPPSAAGVPFLMTAELFTQSHRPAAYVLGGSLNWLCNFTIGFIFPFLQMSAGAFCYLVFCGVCLLVALYVHLVVPETKNKTFVEISRTFASRRAVLPACRGSGKYVQHYICIMECK
uniref:Major facilitator superfamily (MFS) profile domain-containing protein n=1 Tax=Anas zonorhyncha TaxID=75864 RepID=A0A8B9VCS8_9AVES